MKHVNLIVEQGEFVAIMGPSGSGKSTLLHILGCLEHPTSGAYRFNGQDVLNASDRELSHLRAEHIGFVFQTFNLVPTLSIYENIELPFLYRSTHKSLAEHRVAAAVIQVGLDNRMAHKPSELSGGERQRAAIARAISIHPKLILADEPTGNLDSKTGGEVLSLFKNLNRKGATIVMVTHDQNVANHAGRCIHLKDGYVV